MTKIKFHINDKIYIKKYKGNHFMSDTNNIYIISFIITKLKQNSANGSYDKYAILNNGTEQLIYSYSSFTKKYEYYVEHIPWYYKIAGCF